ncbi:trypsin-like peptidase domain-containing protein [Oricola sp.]|uniref:trypsin-like peptidase domain-containing protein n=1 Tax=Oricola sp. TaxID=1979950 RepID=UPI003BAC5D4A
MIEFLKGAARASEQTGKETLPPGTLSFTLEYADRPDLVRERKRLAALLDGDGFDLFAYSEEDDPNLLILQFQGVEIRQSAGFLFEVADELATELGLLSVVPEVGPAWIEIETTADQPEAVGDIVWGACKSDAPSPDDADWARRMIRADAANDQLSATGEGVLIGQPDTGVAEHRELNQGIDKARGYNVIDNTNDPTDPLSAKMSSPGHGTATSSLVISRGSHIVTGSAPGATLVPIRCINAVVIGTGVAVARAIDHARKQGCRIVTMSLGGGIEGGALRRAIKRAVDADMIVLAAAGNCVGFVVYPAWDKNVIAVAGIDENEERWKGSSRGRKVDISAPGENVHVARRKAGSADVTDINKEGQGTSFAVALTAGCAALWIGKFGIDDVKGEARRRDTNVQELFRAALRATARTPSGWNTSKMGAGIVDAYELVSTPLADIPPISPGSSGAPTESVFGNIEFGRHEAEATFLASDRIVRSEAGSALLEAGGIPLPSPGLAELLSERNPDALSQPVVVTSPATPPETPEDLVNRMAAATGSGAFFESTASTDDVMARAEAVLNYQQGISPEAAGGGLRGELLSGIERTVGEMLRTGAPLEARDLQSAVHLEALVELVGRPAVRIQNGEIPFDTSNPALGQWAADLIPLRDQIKPLADAVGRIDIKTSGGWRHVGTGFVIGRGQVMTNRHVLDALAEEFPVSPGRYEMRLTADASINFDPDATNEDSRYKIKSVISYGSQRIGRYVDLSKLDMAILEIETDNGSGGHPAPVDMQTVSTSDAVREQIILVGYPAEPGYASAPTAQQAALDYWDRIREIYNRDFGSKYLSPGLIKLRPGGMEGDERNWAFSHDATTMGGNSGSVVTTLDERIALCGLHFGGKTFSRNMAHDISSIDLNEDLVSPTRTESTGSRQGAGMLEDLADGVVNVADTDNVETLNEACAAFVEQLPREAGSIDPEIAKKVLKALRSFRRFDQMRLVANACLIDGCADARVMHFLAQGLIEAGEIHPAIRLLENAVDDPDASTGDWAELKGALGRAWKDLAVQSRDTRPDIARQAVRESFRHYRDAWQRSNSDYTYQGVNMVAVAYWDDGFGLTPKERAEAKVAAATIVEIITGRACHELQNWDYATVGEALLGVGDHAEAAKWYGAYVKNEDSAFALAGSARQLQQLWSADSEEWGEEILAPMIGRLGLEPGAGFTVSPEALQRLVAVPKLRHEAVLGDIGAQTYDWLQEGMAAARSVAMILFNGKPHGTGFVVKGSDLDESFGDELVVVTNAHVVSDPPEPDAASPSQAVVKLELHRRAGAGRFTYSVREVLWQSPSGEHDVAILGLDPPIPADVEPLRFHERLPDLAEGKKERVYIIGHPGGREISFSFQDNQLLDYEREVYASEDSIAPCRIHYRTPTEPGSSGSPIFDPNWRIIGIHHAGGRYVQMLNGKRDVYEANEGMWIASMRRALRNRNG